MKNGQEKLKARGDRFEALVQSLSDGIVVVDPEGKVVFTNSAAETLLNRSKTELHGQPFGFPILSGESTEIDLRSKNGRSTTVEMRAVAACWDGRPVHIASLRDVSDRVLLEAARTEARKKDAMSIYSGGIAHDFNNLLSIITMAVSMARDGVPPGSMDEENLAEALNACQKMRGLTSILLAIATTDARGILFHSIKAPIEKAAESFCCGSQVHLKATVQEDLWPVACDPSQIETVLEIFLANAVEANNGCGTVLVHAGNLCMETPPNGLSGEKWVTVSVTDEGPGIPRENLARIFDPYFSTKKRSSQKGMGLSLAIADSIAKRHRGAITVDTKPGKGTRFRLLLPAADAERVSEQ